MQRSLTRRSRRDANYPKLSGNPQEDQHASDQTITRHNAKNTRACLSCPARQTRRIAPHATPCKNCKIGSVPRLRAAYRRKSRINPSPLSRQISNAVQSSDAAADLNTRWESTRASISDKAPDPVKDLVLYSAATKYPSFIKPPSARLEDRHLDFLRAEGALSLPDSQIQRAMVEAFAVFTFSYLPIIDLKVLLGTLQDHENNQATTSIGLLLYQAILYAGSSFVDANRFREAKNELGDRTAARAELSRRITLLYDLGYGSDDSIELIQVALIMACGSETVGDWKNSWYWMGQAISLALAMGLNREQARNLDGSFSSDQKLKRRIWWTCYMRDRFLSLGMNRPTRIKDVDCMLGPLALSDFDFVTIDEASTKTSVSSAYSALFRDTTKQTALAEISIHRLRLSQVIDIVTRVQQAYDRSEDEIAAAEAAGWLDSEFSRAEGALEYWQISLPPSCVYRKTVSLERGNESVVVNRNHLHMAFHALKYTLHRPRFLPTSPRRRDPTAKLSSDISGARTVSSAIYISLMTQELDRLGLVSYLPVSGVTVIFPAMAISLLEIKATSTIQQQWAAQRFMICYKAMGVLKETYQTAGAAVDYLMKALEAASLTLDDVALKAGRYDEEASVTDFMESWHPALLLDESVAREYEILGGFEAYLQGEEAPFGNNGMGLALTTQGTSTTTTTTISNPSLKVEDNVSSATSVFDWNLSMGDSLFKGLEQMV